MPRVDPTCRIRCQVVSVSPGWVSELVVETGKYAGESPDLSSAYEVDVEPYAFALTYRDVDIDRGLTIHVFGPANGKREEILRFDCFEKTPHYHLGWSYRDERFIEISDPDPFGWAIDSLSTSFEEFVMRANADLVVTDTSRTEINEALERIRVRGKQRVA